LGDIAFRKNDRFKQMEEVLQKGLWKTSKEYKRLRARQGRIDAQDRAAKDALEKAKAELQEPGPCPTDWLQSARGYLPGNVRRLLDHQFPPDEPGATEESEPLRAYVLLSVLHDKALGGASVPLYRRRYLASGRALCRDSVAQNDRRLRL
jgi:hypothetical protein